ncbi:hypothetical protein RKD54_003635 [Pseudarthrobacter sp. SLBN-100]
MGIVGYQPELQLLEEPPLLFGHWHCHALEISIGTIDIDGRSLAVLRQGSGQQPVMVIP